jgi:hypothetical protein
VSAFWRPAPDGISVAVKVQPRSRRPGLQGAVPGQDGPLLRVAVSDPPEDGRANHAVCAMLAAALDVPVSAVRVTAGAAARQKRLSVSGDPATLAARAAVL